MIDRIPVNTAPNGAIKYGIYDAAGNLIRYEYIKNEDGAVTTGTALNKANLLTDTTAAGLGLPNTATVNEAIAALDTQKTDTGHAHTVSNITGLTPTVTELNYVDGVTSAIQTQFSGKAASSHTHGNITNAGAIGSTADLPVFTTTSGVLTTKTAANALTALGLTATTAELNCVDGVTSAVQTQLDSKAKIATGSYVGTGTFDAYINIVFPVTPKLIMIGKGIYHIHYWASVLTCGYMNQNTTGSLAGNTFSWKNSNSAGQQLNDSGVTYYYAYIY